VLALLLVSGCATVHPRLAPELKEGAGGIGRVVVLWPDIDVRVKYYNTEVYVYSSAESVRASRLFGGNLKKLFEEKGFETTLLPWTADRPDAGQAGTHGAAAICDDSSRLVMPGGLVRDPRACGDSLYEMRIRRAEQLFVEVITVDPGYASKAVPENFRFEAPAADLSSYDLAVVTYGAMREETAPESRHRWLKNLTINAVMVPMAMASFIFPFALPITFSMPFFLDTSPDISWIALVAFEPRQGRVVFINDFFYRRGKMNNALGRASAKMMKRFPERASAGTEAGLTGARVSATTTEK